MGEVEGKRSWGWRLGLGRGLRVGAGSGGRRQGAEAGSEPEVGVWLTSRSCNETSVETIAGVPAKAVMRCSVARAFSTSLFCNWSWASVSSAAVGLDAFEAASSSNSSHLPNKEDARVAK